MHEAIAANCPMLVHHIVPGQEEGNLALLKAAQCGELVNSPAEIHTAIKDLLANNGALWRVQKENMLKVKKPHASQEIANFVLERLS